MRWSMIITLPLSLVIVVFAVTNRQDVVLSLWPFPITITLPLFLPILGSAFVGLLAGMGWLWLPLARARYRARTAERRLEKAGLASPVAAPLNLGPVPSPEASAAPSTPLPTVAAPPALVAPR